MRRALLLTVAATAGACASPQLADPPAITADPTTTTAAPAVPECTPEEAALPATRSFAPSGPLPAPDALPSGSTMAAIRDRDRLVVGVSADTLQFGAIDPITGVVEGFDVDILKEIAKAILGEGGEDKIDFRVMTFAERLPALEAGDVDLVAHTMTINCDRWKRVAFSSTYYDAGKKVLVDDESGFASIEDLVAGQARVCAPSGSTSLALISDPIYAGVEVVERPDVTACLVAVQQGRADAIVGDDTVLVGLAAQDPNLILVGEFLTEEPYGVGVNAEQVDLVQFVNAVLEQIRTNGRWAEIYTDWLDATAPAPPEAVYGR